mgnify:CR=1 FL=1
MLLLLILALLVPFIIVGIIGAIALAIMIFFSLIAWWIEQGLGDN